MSIRTRLLLLALLAAALPVFLALGRFLQDRDESIEADTQRLRFMAQRRAEVIDEKIQGTAQLLYGLARARDLASLDRSVCSAFLGRVRDTYPQYTGIVTILPNGQLFCDSLNTGRELDLRDRAYFQAALSTRQGVVLEPVFGRLTGRAVLQIAHPVRTEGGELQFVLMASLNLQQLMDLPAVPVPGSRLVLLDARGMVLASARPKASLAATDATTHAATAGASGGASAGTSPGVSSLDVAGGAYATGSMAMSSLLARLSAPGQDGIYEGEDPGGALGVWAMAQDPYTLKAGLRVLAGAPKQALAAAADKRLLQDLVFLAAAGLGIFLAVWWVAELGIRRQIARITPMVGRLAEGDLSARIEPPLPRGELGALMTVLNQTAQSLQVQRADIEHLNGLLRQSQRMEAIGQLTGGVAHDFNNLLTVVLGSAELLAERAGADPQERALAEMIVGAAQRGADLTQRLLAFARKQALDPKTVDLHQLVSGMDTMLRRTLGEHIEIELIRGAGLWPALVDRGQLENALLNLCVNARDAMPQGGRLTLETANARLDADYADRYVDLVPGQYVMLAVSDTGHGIAPEQLQHVFEPFFTTKDKGKGTGLGLAMVYGFVKQSAGHVNIYSEVGHGTTVKLYLPRATQGEAADAVEALPEHVGGGTETILVVEDDDAVRLYAANQLRSFGYRVLEAADGPAAMAVIQRFSDIDLLFTDVVMPGGMNGRALADAARALRPELKVLYTSGYTENAIVHHGRLDAGALLLNKPYRRSALDRAVRAALATVSV